MVQTIQKNIRVTPEQWKRIENEAEKREMSPNRLVVEFVMEALERRRFVYAALALETIDGPLDGSDGRGARAVSECRGEKIRPREYRIALGEMGERPLDGLLRRLRPRRMPVRSAPRAARKPHGAGQRRTRPKKTLAFSWASIYGHAGPPLHNAMEL